MISLSIGESIAIMVFVNPFRKRRCPSCGTLFHPGNCAIVSSITASRVLQEARSGFFSRFWLEPTNGPLYTKELACRRCPNPDCYKLLPSNIERAKSYTIAVVGDVTSGKSHFIASCIQQLKQKQALQVIGCNRIVAQGNSDTHYYQDYYKPVYIDLQQIPLTPPGKKLQDPLIYELTFPSQSWLQPGRSINLLFYDSSGEDIAEQERLVQYSHYILNASAIIFLADPLTMPGIVKRLPAHLRPGARRERSTSEVLNRVIQTFEMNNRIKPGARLKTPVAIALSKSDVLKYVTRYDRENRFLTANVYSNMLDTRQFDPISEEVQNLLQRVGDDVLIQSSNLFEHVSFFAISATGWPPDAQGKFPSIEPLRCLDPLLWVLWKLGVVPTHSA